MPRLFGGASVLGRPAKVRSSLRHLVATWLSKSEAGF